MKTVLFRAKHLLAAAVPLVLLALGGTAGAQEYDPLAVDPSFQPSPVDLTIHDARRHRDIPQTSARLTDTPQGTPKVESATSG